MVTLRAASAADAPAVATLHAESWRRHYRGAYSDAFLDADVWGDRLAVWSDRLASCDESSMTLLAEQAGELVGFVHTIVDADPTWGALVDNLHVDLTHQGRGIGRRLLARSAGFVVDRADEPRLYLWVLERNVSAQGFYDALGGEPVESRPVPPIGGRPERLAGAPVCLRYVWRDATVLARCDQPLRRILPR